MQTSNNRLSGELAAVMSILCPEVELDRLTVRMDEVLSNYKVIRLSDEEMEADLADKIQIYISAMKLNGLSPITLYDYTIELNAFARYCKKPTSLITTGDIRLYLGTLEGVMKSTLGKKITVLKSFFGWLVREELLLRNPMDKIDLPKLPKRKPKSLTVEELEVVREACKTLRERALIEVFYSTGCRLSEVANMKRSDINVQAMSMNVVGKGDKERTVYLSFKAMYHLKKYLKSRNDTCEYLFIAERGEPRKLSNATIGQIVKRIAKRTGIEKDIHPHIFRHTFSQLAVDSGIEIADLQHLLGHSDPGTSLIYAEVSEERKKQAHKKYHVM